MNTKFITLIALFATTLFCSCEKDYVAPNNTVDKPNLIDPVEEIKDDEPEVKKPIHKYMPYQPGSEAVYVTDAFQYSNNFNDSVFFQNNYWLEYTNGATGEIEKIRSNGIYTYVITKVEGVLASLRIMKEDPKVGDNWTNYVPRSVDAIYIEKEITATGISKEIDGVFYEDVTLVKTTEFYKNGSELKHKSSYSELFASGFGLIFSEKDNVRLKQLTY